jgi:hypothetical protein
MNALLAGIGRSNAAGDLARTLQRHARAAADEIQREIDRLSDREAGVLFWGQSIGATTAVGAVLGFATGTLATGGALAVIAAGAGLFAVATRERAASGAEKDRRRRGRDAVRQLADELAETAAAFEKEARRPDM